MKVIFLILAAMIVLSNAQAQEQQTPESLDQLKKEILELKTEVKSIQTNLSTSQKKFRTGIAVATIGYSVTIAGGLMLGRRNDDLGKVLLVAGGATGITGTVLMVDAFRFLTGGKKKRQIK